MDEEYIMTIYGAIFRNFLFPAYEKLQARNTIRYLKDANDRLSDTTKDIEEFQLQKLKLLLLYCNKNVPYYRAQWEKIGFDPELITHVSELERLPVLTKDDVRNNYEDLIPSFKKGHNIVKSTGGSTGQPFHFELDIKSYETRQAIMWRGYGWMGAGLGVKSWFLWGIDCGEPNLKSQIKMGLYHGFHHRKIANSFALSQENMQSYVDSLNNYEPEAIVGYVAPLYLLAKYINENKVPIKAPKTLITGAEALHQFQREEMEKAFGCKVYNTYGCREFMLIAAECSEYGALHTNIDQLVVETVNDELKPVIDQKGDVLVTDLFNYGMPLIRYVNGDQATLTSNKCGCGNPLPLIKEINGRKLDIIQTKSGVELGGPFFPHLLKDYKGIEKFQVIQKSLDSIDLIYIINVDFHGDELASIETEIKRYTGEELDIRFKQVENIALTKAGKHRVTISELT